jgi:hypothetical protein
VSPRRWIAILVAAIAALHAWWILHYGILWGADIDRLSAWADSLVAHRFNVAAYLRDTPFVAPPILYLGFVTVVAVAKVLAGSHWPALVVALNWIAVIAIASLVLTTVWHLTSSLVGLFAAGALLANFELLQFVSFPMTDVLFAGLGTVAIVMALRVADRPSAGVIAGGTAALLAACVFRPAAAPLIVVWIVALAWPRVGKWIVPATAALIVIGMLLFAAVMQEPARWPFEALRVWMDYLKRNYAAGMIVVGRPETWVAPPSRYVDYLAMIGLRWAYFFAIVMRGYSRLHNLINVLYFVPAYGLAIAAIVLRRTTATLLLFLAILVTSAFHGIQEVDFDHRYRLPILPPLIMLAGLGAAEVARRVRT